MSGIHHLSLPWRRGGDRVAEETGAGAGDMQPSIVIVMALS